MYRLVTRNENIKELIESIKKSDRIGLDTEANSRFAMLAKPLLLQIKAGKDIFIINLVKDSKLGYYTINLIDSQKKLCIFHNAKYDLKIIKKFSGIWLRNIYDTFTGEILIHQGIGKQYYSLNDLTEHYFKVTLDKDIRETFENSNGNFTQEQLLYSSLDVLYLEQIMDKQVEILTEQKQTDVLNLEMGLLPVVAEMEWNGVLIDKEKWTSNIAGTIIDANNLNIKLKEILGENLKITGTAYDMFDLLKMLPKTKKGRNRLIEIKEEEQILKEILDTVNFNSTAQLKAVITKVFNIPVPNTQEKTILKYKNTCNFIKVLLEYREVEKKNTTYGENILELINPETGRIHAEFNQLGTVTGRFSCNKPNLQQVPQNNAYRSPFIARPGYKIITADYSQAELRLLAAVSRDPVMTKAFIDGIDLHKTTASILFEVPVEKIDDIQRKAGKTLNFAVVYGTSEYGLYNNFGIPIEEGREYLRKYFSKDGYYILGNFIHLAGNKILELKYSLTPYGRKRFFEHKILYTDWFEKRKEIDSIKRQGINHIIQGGSADIVKLSMLEIGLTNPFGSDNFMLLMQVHDEIVIEVKEELVEDAKKFVNDVMVRNEQMFLKNIPAVVDIHVANCWKK